MGLASLGGLAAVRAGVTGCFWPTMAMMALLATVQLRPVADSHSRIYCTRT